MPRFCFALRLALLLIIALPLCANAASPTADQIFPDTTKGFVAIRNLDEFTEQWSQTQFGQLMNDPLMDNFKKEVQKQLTERMEQTFGLTFEGIFSFTSGEVALGMITVPSQTAGYALTMDITGKRTETNEYLTNLTQKLVSAGVKQTTETYREQQMTILTFPPPKVPPVLRGARVEITLEPIERKVYYMFWQDVLIASDQLHLIQLLADRLASQDQETAKSLAEVEAYQIVMKRCISDIPNDGSPILRWYIEPLDYGESVRAMMQNRGATTSNQRNRPSVFAVLKQQGFDAIRGIGGVISMNVEEHESVYRTFIHTQKPYRLAMQMLEFPDNIHFAPPTWMPNDLARCTMVYADPLAIFDNVGVLFDAIVMPGEEGVWRDILHDLKHDPYGPKIDVREELVVHLGNRVLGMSRYEKPITVKSESMVLAVELKEGRESVMLAGIEKLFGTDPEMQATAHRSYRIWHRKPLEDIIEPGGITIDIPGDELFGTQGTAQAARTTPQREEEDRPPVFPEGGVVVAKGCLFVSTNIEYLKVILDRLDTPVESSIGNEAEYLEVKQIFANLGLTDKPHFFQFFARTHETLRPTYEMVRLDRMARSQALLAKLLNEVLSPEEETGIRRQIIDGSTLPEFDKIEQYFGTVGIFGASEESGYFIKGFAQKRK